MLPLTPIRTPSACSIMLDMRVVLTEQFGEEAMVVEVEFERIFGGWLRNGVAKPRAVYCGMDDPESWISSSAALRGS